jgi:hypothetical protein
MPTRDAVKDYQRRLAQLDAAHMKAKGQLEDAIGKRVEALAIHDELVAQAAEGVRRAVADIAVTFGTEMAANLAGLDRAGVRRMVKVGGKA